MYFAITQKITFIWHYFLTGWPGKLASLINGKFQHILIILLASQTTEQSEFNKCAY